MHSASGLDAQAGFARIRVTATTEHTLLVEIASAGQPFPERASWAVLPELWHASVPVAPAPDGFATSALRVRLDGSTLALAVDDHAGRPICHDHRSDPIRLDAPGFRLRKRAPPGECYYGLGDKPGPLEKRGHAYTMWNTDAFGFQEAWDPLYKSVPFLLAVGADRLSWGLFLDNTHRTGFDLAATTPDAITIAATGGPARYHLILGPSPGEVLERYTALTGRIELPPLWSLGYQQSRYSYETQARALEVARHHREHRIPLDALWLDIGFQDRNRPFTVDPAAYPDLGGFVSDIASLGIATVVITDLHLPIPLAGEAYAPTASGLAGDHFVKSPDGTDYVGAVWPGDCHFPDFTRSGTRAWWGTLFERFHTEYRISGFWNDMNEPAVFDVPGHTMPDEIVHRIDEPGFVPRTATHAEIHNVYGMQNARATHDGLRALSPDRRPFVLTRASYAGGQRFSATWTGDNTSSANHMRLSTPQLLSLGLCGFALAGCDIGGFKDSPEPDLLTRWIALGAFNPLFRNHTDYGSRDQEAWVHGEHHLALRRRAIEQRYELLAYFYTAIETAARTGIPPMRPMFLDWPDAALRAQESQFMFGPDLLVAPPPDDTLDPYKLLLPDGRPWYDWHTAALQPPTAWDPQERKIGPVRLERALGRVPVFVRGGAIVPRHASVAHSGLVPEGPLRLDVFPDDQGAAQGSVYCDDGSSLAHRGGACFRQHFDYASGTLAIGAPQGSFTPWWRELELVLHGGQEPARRTVAPRPARHVLRPN